MRSKLCTICGAAVERDWAPLCCWCEKPHHADCLELARETSGHACNPKNQDGSAEKSGSPLGGVGILGEFTPLMLLSLLAPLVAIHLAITFHSDSRIIVERRLIVPVEESGNHRIVPELRRYLDLEEPEVDSRHARAYLPVYNSEGYDRFGFDRHGYDRAGHGPMTIEGECKCRRVVIPGHDPAACPYGYDKDGFDPAGYDREGYDSDGYDRTGLTRSGFGRDGYDRSGYDKDGFDREGNCRVCRAYRAVGFECRHEKAWNPIRRGSSDGP